MTKPNYDDFRNAVLEEAAKAAETAQIPGSLMRPGIAKAIRAMKTKDTPADIVTPLEQAWRDGFQDGEQHVHTYARPQVDAKTVTAAATQIRAFFSEAAGSKLEAEPDGTLFDNDSNWGFSPLDLAQRIVGDSGPTEKQLRDALQKIISEDDTGPMEYAASAAGPSQALGRAEGRFAAIARKALHAECLDDNVVLVPQEPSNATLRAMWEAMTEQPWTGANAPLMGAVYAAAIGSVDETPERTGNDEYMRGQEADYIAHVSELRRNREWD